MFNYKRVRQYHLEHTKKQSPSHGSKILMFGFGLIILIGTVLLKLPIATEAGHHISWGEAFFTSVSATTVTGLTVVSTEATFTTFGEIIILALIQVGGIGFITLSVILFALIGRRVTIYERALLSQNLGVGKYQGVVQLTLIVIAITFSIEFVGAIIMFSQWVQDMDWQTAAYYAIFHAISAYCNAGFDLFKNLNDPLLEITKNSPILIFVMSILIVIGTLGITVIYDIISWPKKRCLSLHTSLILPLTLLLILFGTILVMVDETFVEGHALSQLPTGEKILMAFFTIVSSRTAGLTLIPIEAMGQASQLVIFISMFIGGSPASMAGGIGLSTVAVVLVTLFSTVRGYHDARVFDRTLPIETIFKAVAVLTISTTLVVTVTLILILLNEGQVFPIAFEVISAFSNTGYSVVNTSDFNETSRLLLAFTMFWGRLGPLTLIVALAQRRRQSLIHYPEEKIIIG